MYLIVRNTDDVVVAITGKMDRVATTENGDTVTVEPDLATAVYDAEGGMFYRLSPAFPGDTPHRLVEVESIPEGMTAGRCRWVDGGLVAYVPSTPLDKLQEENKLLTARVTALAEQNEFQEELIVELAGTVYA